MRCAWGTSCSKRWRNAGPHPDRDPNLNVNPDPNRNPDPNPIQNELRGLHCDAPSLVAVGVSIRVRVRLIFRVVVKVSVGVRVGSELRVQG